MNVRLIGKANGVGLSRDFDLLYAALGAAGCEVTRRPCERPDRKRRRGLWTRALARARGSPRWPGRAARRTLCDVNVMLEHVWPQFLHEARCNVVVPNPEWFDRRDVAFLPAIDRIWAKTRVAEALFRARGCASSCIGFDSEDRFAPQIAREPRFLHLAGRSPLKGTARLIAAWRRHAQWPQLTVVQDRDGDGHGHGESDSERGPAANIHFMHGYLGDEALRVLQNSHRFHLCPSEAEGWGHYIAEAMSVGAVTLTSDAAPMNELVEAERGLLIGGHEGRRQNLICLYRFDEQALEAAVERALRLSEAQLLAMGGAARRWFVANKQSFTARIAQAVAQLGARAKPATPTP